MKNETIQVKTLLEEIEKCIEIRRTMMVHFDGRVCSCFAVKVELRDIIRFINKQKNNE